MISIILRTCYGSFWLYKSVNCQHEVLSHYCLIRNGYRAHGLGWTRREVQKDSCRAGTGVGLWCRHLWSFLFLCLDIQLCPDMVMGHIFICFRPGVTRPYALWFSFSWGKSFMPSCHKVLKGLRFQAPRYFNITSKTRRANRKFGNYSLSFNSNYNSWDNRVSAKGEITRSWD